MAAAVLLENHDDNKAIQAIQTIRVEFQGQLFEKIRPMNRNPMEILPRLQTSLDLQLQLLRNPEIHRGDLVVERMQTVIVSVFPCSYNEIMKLGIIKK
jgi:hypothetical protein